ncbi:hypothetical protein FA13DRAFT_1054359 [Coprinellus micaceus]|uniref:Uncharacterized protein n=1 Tax=Coprinellus micaceus TaxID=71717 RepID=A0A4Y7SWZ2_COPMI|nr:hypothetical protein FA13DRAFT_1054359 [Coprinellus micaceus]
MKLILTVFTYGPDQRRTEIELRPATPESTLGDLPRVSGWLDKLALTMAPDFKFTNEWGCEVCGSLPSLKGTKNLLDLTPDIHRTDAWEGDKGRDHRLLSP